MTALAIIGAVALVGLAIDRLGQDSRPGFDESNDPRFGALR